MISTPIDIAATAAARHPFAEPGVRTIRLERHFHTSQRSTSFHADYRQPIEETGSEPANFKWEEGQWLTT
jgi:hypothetical protein